MKIKNYLNLSILSLCLLVMKFNPSYAQDIKVFILAGQSNMQGHGDIYPVEVNGTLAHFMANGGNEDFSFIQDANGDWATRNDVWVRYDDENGDLRTGILDIGFGGYEEQIGPEYGFGHRLGPQTDDHVLIIKTCWGGKSLGKDFRPPSSGGTTGEYYNQMINDINLEIENITTEFPEYTGGNIEIAGMAWLQGWNDAERPEFWNEYEQNLINLISDVRTDLNVVDLPFVIGLAGNGGFELEPAGNWVYNLQTKIVQAQINAAGFLGHENVSYVETRSFWRSPELSPEPDFLHHWNNNAESYLRIGDALGKEMNNLINKSNGNGESLGFIRANTNPALPSSYNFLEYVYPEPKDQGDCLGIVNNTAVINEFFLSQTHRHAIGHPLLFTIGERPALLQVAVTGIGASPDIKVEGILDGNSLGTLCLKGPTDLSASINLETPNFDDYFSVTLPKKWIKIGLELKITAGDDLRNLSQNDLQITPYTELNLVQVDMDIMDYNHEPYRTPAFDDFLEELASAIPASVVRFGKFPGTLEMPEFALQNNEDNTVVVSMDEMLGDNALNTGNVNFYATDIISYMKQSTGDYPNTVYFGNTLNLDPGGWGGGGSFVSFDYTDIFIHELGHALSLPHWGEDYRIANPGPWQYSYPYEGEEGEGSGRGEAWNFIQDKYEFVSPTCENENGVIGTERSDCMQRGFACIETRSYGTGPWDGFGDFSAKAINNYLLGSSPSWGQVEDRGELIDFHLRENDGYPVASLENGKRVFNRHSSQPNNTFAEEFIKLPGEEKIEQEVYLIFGSVHSTLTEANIIYKPVKYKGTLLPIIDPTDPEMFATLKDLSFDDAPEMFGRIRDVTLKLTYIDGTVSHALIPFQSFDRPEDFPDENPRPKYFTITVPGDTLLCNVELYHRDFILLDDEVSERGNINDPLQNITAENFMNEAVLMASLDHSCNCPGTPGYIEPGTPCDDGNPLTTNDVEDGFCNCQGVPVAPCGQIANGQFEENLEGWWTWGNDASSTDTEAFFENINLGDAGIAQGNFVFENNESYIINFDAYAAAPRLFDVIIYLDEEPYTEYYRETVALDTTRASYELTFTFNAEQVVNGALEFYMGDEEASIFLDNICLDINCAGQTEIPYNGLDDDCDPETLDDDLDQDGFVLANDCDDENPAINPALPEEPYNGIDDDCNPETLDDDLDGDGFLLANDCNDLNPNINPDAEEIANNDIDEDCDGSDLITTSTETLTAFDFYVYPNPIEDIINIVISEDIKFKASIYDVNARLIKTVENQKVINVQDLPQGVYLMKIQDLANARKPIAKILTVL